MWPRLQIFLKDALGIADGSKHRLLIGHDVISGAIDRRCYKGRSWLSAFCSIRLCNSAMCVTAKPVGRAGRLAKVRWDAKSQAPGQACGGVPEGASVPPGKTGRMASLLPRELDHAYDPPNRVHRWICLWIFNARADIATALGRGPKKILRKASRRATRLSQSLRAKDGGLTAGIWRGRRLRGAATPNRAVRMAGSFAASANPHDCGDARNSAASRNAIRGLI
jgi:hypothetical protein